MEFYGGMTVMEYCLVAHYIVIYASQGKSKAVGSGIACDEDSEENGQASELKSPK